MQDAISVIGSVIAASGAVPYIIATVKRQTKPRLVTWFTWFLLTALAAAAAFSDRHFAAGFFALLGALSTGAVVVAGFRYSDRNLTKLDIACLAGVAVGLGLWLTMDAAVIGVWTAIIIDFVGLVPTLRHAWQQPAEETALTFALVGIGGMITVVAIAAGGQLSVTSVGYPLYAGVSLGLTALLVVARRKQLAPAAAEK